jgi:predicted transcriptional regulator YheO
VKGDALPPELALLSQLIEGLQTTLGRTAEITLHNFRNPDHSLAAIAGKVTGRSVGAPMTDRLLETMRRHGNDAPNIINVKTRTRDGRLLRSSTLFIRNSKGKVIGSMGINVDLTDQELAARVLADLVGSIDFAADVSETMQSMIEIALHQSGRAPQLLSREERLELIRILDTKGLFLIRGAVDEVATRLGVSRFTVYGYLDEIRKETKAT